MYLNIKMVRFLSNSISSANSFIFYKTKPVSKSRILFEGPRKLRDFSSYFIYIKGAQKAQFGSNAEPTRQYVSILKRIATRPSGKIRGPETGFTDP